MNIKFTFKLWILGDKVFILRIQHAQIKNNVKSCCPFNKNWKFPSTISRWVSLFPRKAIFLCPSLIMISGMENNANLFWLSLSSICFIKFLRFRFLFSLDFHQKHLIPVLFWRKLVTLKKSITLINIFSLPLCLSSLNQTFFNSGFFVSILVRKRNHQMLSTLSMVT